METVIGIYVLGMMYALGVAVRTYAFAEDEYNGILDILIIMVVASLFILAWPFSLGLRASR